MEKKNTKAIEKIITELSKRDYESRCKKLTKSQIDNIRQGKKTLSDYGGYSLSQETMEAICNLRRPPVGDALTSGRSAL